MQRQKVDVHILRSICAPWLTKKNFSNSTTGYNIIRKKRISYKIPGKLVLVTSEKCDKMSGVLTGCKGLYPSLTQPRNVYVKDDNSGY